MLGKLHGPSSGSAANGYGSYEMAGNIWQCYGDWYRVVFDTFRKLMFPSSHSGDCVAGSRFTPDGHNSVEHDSRPQRHAESIKSPECYLVNLPPLWLRPALLRSSPSGHHPIKRSISTDSETTLLTSREHQSRCPAICANPPVPRV
jgi:hypothetical protein